MAEKHMQGVLCQGAEGSLLDRSIPICTLGAGSGMPIDAIPMTTAEATVAALIAHGIDTLYALPGVHNDYLFDALFKLGDRINTIHTRHEQGCAYMALGAALATGKPQSYAVVPGPGLLNSGAALLTAYGMNAPVLALVHSTIVRCSSSGCGTRQLRRMWRSGSGLAAVWMAIARKNGTSVSVVMWKYCAMVR
jgi:hypothetical protein